MFLTLSIGNKCVVLKKQSVTSVTFDASTVTLSYRGMLRERSTETIVPTVFADYFHNASMRGALMELAAVCSQNGLDAIIIHSNHFESITSFNPHNLTSVRSHYIDLLQELDVKFRRLGIQLLVENMPIIGNNGDDFDSIFVFPDDFDGFERFTNVGIAWDFGHWAFTVALMKKIADVSRMAVHSAPDFWDFRHIFPLIRHFHLSSFRGLAVPELGSRCVEGMPPQSGDFDPSLFEKALQLAAAEKAAGVSLEISEVDYRDRINLRKTLEWMRDIHLV